MDGRGRLAQSLTRIAAWRARPSARAPLPFHAQALSRSNGPGQGASRVSAPFSRLARRSSSFIFKLRIPKGVGIAASLAFLLAAVAYGVAIGDRTAMIVGAFKDARDAAANAAGFRIASIALTGERHVSREEVLAAAGVTGTASLLFLDLDGARERLKANPWIADATLLKLYPDRVQIDVKEREPFALWQQAGRVSVVAADGTVLEPYVSPRLARLPLVVGVAAAPRAKEFLALLDRYPELRDQVRASILIAERRWNLRLRNGLDVRLPESGVAEALATLVALDKDKKLLTRDIVAIDLRLPDRVTVQLTEAAANARAEALKAKKPVKKGDAA
jgi:cell division protein FtsQ